MEQKELLKSFLLILLLVGFVILVGLSIKTGCNKTTEGWLNFMNIPYGQVIPLKDPPIYMYACPEYRLPYNWPVGIKTESPMPHIAPFKMGVL